MSSPPCTNVKPPIDDFVATVLHRPQGPCSQGASNMKAGIQCSYSLPTHYDGCPTFNAIYQGPQIVDRETFHSGSRNNLNFHFKFAILIRQNKCDHLGLLFYVLSFIQFCALKLLLPIVGLVLKFIFNYRVFFTKLYAHEMFGSREELFFRVAPKNIWSPCKMQSKRATNTLQALVTSWKNGIRSYSPHRGKEQCILHEACYDGSPATSFRKSNFVVKVVGLGCCEKQCASYLRLRIS